MATKHWLVKSEPYKYSWADLVKDKRTYWDGVRNFEARNNLRAMKKGDLVLFYHSNEGKEVVGVARVARGAYADPTAQQGDWSVVNIVPLRPLEAPVSLAAIKGDDALQDIALIKRSRLSVVPVSAVHFKRILKLGGTRL